MSALLLSILLGPGGYGGTVPGYNASIHPAGSALQLNDDINLIWGTGSDWSCQWDTALTPDVLMCGDGTTPDQDVLWDNGTAIVFGAPVTNWTGDGVSYSNDGAAGTPRPTDVAPQGFMIRCQPAFPGGAQTACVVVVCGGQDETTITIDDFSLCEDDTVTITVVNSNNASTATILTESELGGNDWNAVTSNAQTATNLAAQLNDGTPDGVTATAAAAVVRIVLDSDTCLVTLAESDAACTTVSVGTAGVVSIQRTLDMNAFPITNIGAAGTDFSGTGSLTISGTITVNAGGSTSSFGGPVAITTGSTSSFAGGGAVTFSGAVTTTGLTTTNGGLTGSVNSVVGADSLVAADCGRLTTVTAGIDTATLTLPEASTVLGCTYVISYIGADAGALLDISPLDTDADGIEGSCTLAASVVTFTGTADADIGLTKATGLTGDFIKLTAATADVWIVTGCQGIWANN